MATTHPRTAITLPEDVKRTYARAAGLMGTSLSKAMANVLTEAKPALDSLCDVLESQDSPSASLVKLAALSREMNNENQTDIFDKLAKEKGRK